MKERINITIPTSSGFFKRFLILSYDSILKSYTYLNPTHPN